MKVSLVLSKQIKQMARPCLISNSMNYLGLDLIDCCCFGFDGASNMNGVNRGVATRFKDVSPLGKGSKNV